MENISQYMVPGKRAHLIGIGGVSMSPLAEVLHRAANYIGFKAMLPEGIQKLNDLWTNLFHSSLPPFSFMSNPGSTPPSFPISCHFRPVLHKTA